MHTLTLHACFECVKEYVYHIFTKSMNTMQCNLLELVSYTGLHFTISFQNVVQFTINGLRLCSLFDNMPSRYSRIVVLCGCFGCLWHAVFWKVDS